MSDENIDELDSEDSQNEGISFQVAVWEICNRIAKDKGVPFSYELINSLSLEVHKLTCNISRKLEFFAKHGKRSVITMEDFKLYFRKCFPQLIDVIDKLNEEYEQNNESRKSTEDKSTIQNVSTHKDVSPCKSKRNPPQASKTSKHQVHAKNDPSKTAESSKGTKEKAVNLKVKSSKIKKPLTTKPEVNVKNAPSGKAQLSAATKYDRNPKGKSDKSKRTVSKICYNKENTSEDSSSAENTPREKRHTHSSANKKSNVNSQNFKKKYALRIRRRSSGN